MEDTPLMKVTVVVNMLIALASKGGRYTGGKLAVVCHPDKCPIYENQAHTDGPPETTMAAVTLIPFVRGQLSLLSTTFIRVV